MKYCDALIVGYAVNSTSGGFTDRNVKYVDTVSIKYLYSHFYGTYCAEPVAFLQLAAETRNAGLKVEILDGLLLGYSRNEMEQYLLEYDTNIYFFSLYESSKQDVLYLMKYVKDHNPSAVIVTGGPYVTLCYQELLETEPVIDYIVIGDGDRAMPRLVNALLTDQPVNHIPNVVYRDSDGCAVVDVKPEAVDMNELQPLARDFVDIIKEKGFSLSMVSSRGCGHAVCSFCYLQQYQKNSCQPKYRYRDPALVVAEMKDLIKQYHIKKLTFVDDDFFGTNTDGISRAEELFHRIIREEICLHLYMNVRVASVEELIRRNLLGLAYQAGVRYFFIGFESYNDNILKRYHKGITTGDIDAIIHQLEYYHISVNPGLITFDYDIRPEQVKNNVDLLNRLHYYDLFMFTRTLMNLPNEERGMRDNRIRSGDFLIPETEMLYNALIDFRDRLYPLYGIVDRHKITDKIRNSIIQQHFAGFYELFDAITGKRPDSIENIIMCRVNQIAELIDLAKLDSEMLSLSQWAMRCETI